MATGDLTSLANVRSFLRIPDAQTSSDTLLTTLVSQASRAIKKHTGRDFAPDETGSVARVFHYYGGGLLYFTPFDCRTVTAVSIDTDTDGPLTLTVDDDYTLLPVTVPDGVYECMELKGQYAGSRQANGLKSWREVTVTGTWGFASVPADIAVAANMLVAFWYRQHSAVPGSDLAGEGDRFGPVNMPTGVMQLLAPYRVVGFGLGA